MYTSVARSGISDVVDDEIEDSLGDSGMGKSISEYLVLVVLYKQLLASNVKETIL